MSVTLVIPSDVAGELKSAAGGALETAGVLLARLLLTPSGEIRLLADAIRWVPDSAYRKRTSDEMLITSDGFVPALGEAEERGLVPIWLHTHPGERGVPLPSIYDRRVDVQLADTFRTRSGADFYGTLIVSPRNGGLAFSGALQSEFDASKAIDRLWEVGDRWRLTLAYDATEAVISDDFDRNVKAFGLAIQTTLGGLRIGIAGAGGTGSSVAEQLVRLGVRDLVIIDVDTLSASNVTRVYGSTPADVGRPKVDVLKDHLQRIAPNLRCETRQAMITTEDAARQFVGCDLIFGCTDDNAGRLVLSRMATYLLAPVVDLGVLLSSGDNGELSGINGRITILGPGTACLVCRDRIDLARAASELKTPEERARLEAEGYAPALGRAEPAVVAFTTSVAAAAVGELLERLIGYGPEPRPTEVLLRWHEREISTNNAAPRPGHYCDRASGKWGQGGTAPFLGQVWPNT